MYLTVNLDNMFFNILLLKIIHCLFSFIEQKIMLNNINVSWSIVNTALEMCDFSPEKEDEGHFCLCS